MQHVILAFPGHARLHFDRRDLRNEFDIAECSSKHLPYSVPPISSDNLYYYQNVNSNKLSSIDNMLLLLLA